ncbi:MAG: CoA transferase [candidate division NC10 bacterium]|nr:CoA transferase [candidate division NC10 bacterium]
MVSSTNLARDQGVIRRTNILPSALEDIRVLDVSQGIAGPLCAKLLGDFGADVIKIEPPGGDSGRRMPPFFQDDPHPEKSLFFLLLNLNKRGITLDLAKPQGADIFKKLARLADVVVDSFPPGYLASLGLDHASLERENPGLLMTSITPFGQTGLYSRYKGEEILAYAMSGIMSISGTTDREPLKHGGFPAQYEAGFNGTVATLFALLLRDVTGAGQHVDVSAQEVVNSTMVINQPFYSWTGGVQGRRPPTGNMFGNVMPCKDGYFVSQAGGGASWDDLAEFYGRQELKEERFADVNQRVVNGQALDELLIEATRDRTMAEMFKTASEQYRMLFGIVQTPADLAHCPQLEARGFYQEVEHPMIGAIKVPFTLWNMTETPARYRRPAPLLGQHNAEVYADILGYTEEEAMKLQGAGVI